MASGNKLNGLGASSCKLLRKVLKQHREFLDRSFSLGVDHMPEPYKTEYEDALYLEQQLKAIAKHLRENGEAA